MPVRHGAAMGLTGTHLNNISSVWPTTTTTRTTIRVETPAAR